MTGPRPALLVPDPGAAAPLRRGLDGLGLRPVVIRGGGPGLPIPEELLRRRGFTPGLTGAPGAAWRLRRAAPDLAHAWSTGDALAAALWRQATGRPVVFTCTEVLERATVADRRLRLRLLDRAVASSDAVRAATEEVREGLERWMAVEVPVLGLDDAAGHAALYRRLVGVQAGTPTGSA